MIKYFTIEDLLKHYLQKKFHILGAIMPRYFLNSDIFQQYKTGHSFQRLLFRPEYNHSTS